MPQLLQPLAITRLTWLTSQGNPSQRALLDLQAIQRLPGLAGYWPADPAYLFEDSAGTIPANTDGTGVVGYWRRAGAAPVYTPVSINNPGFDTDTGWTKGTGWSIADGVATHVGPTSGNLSQAVSFAPGATYLITWTMTRTAGSIRPVFFGKEYGTAQYGDYISASGTYSENLVAATGNITLVFEATPDFAGTIDNVNLVTVSNSPALQNTTTKKPILRRTPTSNVYWLNSDTDDELTATLGNLGASCTVARAGAEGVTFTEGVTISSTYNIAPAFGFNGDVAIFNRALTASEKALLTRYMARGVPLLGSELVTNGGFDSADNWTLGNATGTLDITGGALTLTNTSEGGYVRAVNSVPFTIAATDYIYVAATRIPGAFFAANAAAGFNIDGSAAAFATPVSYVSSFYAVKVVSGGTPRAIVVVQTSTIGATASFSSVSMRKIS